MMEKLNVCQDGWAIYAMFRCVRTAVILYVATAKSLANVAVNLVITEKTVLNVSRFLVVNTVIAIIISSASAKRVGMVCCVRILFVGQTVMQHAGIAKIPVNVGWSGKTCKECQVLPGCQHGTCSKPLECKCDKGWTGILCQTPICAENCRKDTGYCRKPGECRCRVGWWGPNCEQCHPYPGCVNGNCTRPWECNCYPGWGGMFCDEELKYCEENLSTCLNGGACISLAKEDGSYRCQCAEGFAGKNCETDKNKGEVLLIPSTTSPTSSATTQITNNINTNGASTEEATENELSNETKKYTMKMNKKRN